ncbi:hypothetical protein BDP27DRAFT_1332137, partial [Rhodocollybia butyracea]
MKICNSSTVIQNIRGSTLTQVIYHYCDFRDQHSTNVKTIFHSLLAQLVKQNSQQWNEKLCKIPEPKLNISGLLPTINMVVDWVIDDISSQKQTTVYHTSVPKVSLFVSSRQERDIYDLLRDRLVISLADEQANVSADITVHIAHELKYRPKLS